MTILGNGQPLKQGVGNHKARRFLRKGIDHVIPYGPIWQVLARRGCVFARKSIIGQFGLQIHRAGNHDVEGLFFLRNRIHDFGRTGNSIINRHIRAKRAEGIDNGFEITDIRS